MFVTIITDCSDNNALGRVSTRASSLFGFPAISVGVDFKGDNQAAGNLIDILDACEGREGIVLANVAPRDGKAKKWPNGTPFGFFFFNNTLVVATIDGLVLSLVKKMGLTKNIRVFDIPTVMEKVPSILDYYPGQKDYIKETQFRSFEFMPRVAKWIWDKIELPVDKIPIEEVRDIEPQIWLIDNFGNCKTTFLPGEVDFAEGKTLNIEGIGPVSCYRRLKDVPDDTAALVMGSSGLKDERFLELVMQGKNVAQKYNLTSGSRLKLI